MKTFLVVAFAAFCTILSSCRKPAEDAVCDTGIITLPTSITGATIGTVGTRMGFSLGTAFTNGCGVWRGMESSISGNTITLRLKGQYTGCACTDVYHDVQFPYAYDPDRAGTFTIQVLQPTGAPKVHTFIVQ